MKTRVINLFKPTSPYNFKERLTALIKRMYFESRYIECYIELIMNNNEIIKLNDKVIVKINDKESINTFALSNEIKFITTFKKLNKVNVDKIVFYYIESNEESYKNYINSLKQFSPIKIEKGNPSRLGYNISGKRFYSNYSKSSLKLNTWYDFSYYLNGKILLSEHIGYAVREFWLKIIENLEESQYILIQFKLKTTDNEYVSISYVQTANLADLERINKIFQRFWSLKIENYHLFVIDSIVFTYKVLLKKGSIGESKLIEHKKVLSIKNKPFVFGGYKLPNTMDITKWSGNIQFNEDFTSAVVYLNNETMKYHVQLFDNYQKVQIVEGKDIIIEFIDYVDTFYDLSTFVRIIKGHKYFFVNGELVVKQIERKVNFLTKLEKDSTLSNKIITMDLETRNINGILEPYCVNTYYVDSDGLERSQPFYLTDYQSPDNLLKAAVNSLLRPKFNGYTIYLHNFSNFDGIFLIRIFSELNIKVKPIIRDGRFINITIKYGYNFSNTLKFRDSLLLLTGSLADLAKDFEIDFNKGIFPYKFVNNPEIKLNYIGEVPDFKYFEGITFDQYKEYCSTKSNNFWDLESETKFYCHLDCKILYLVLIKFGKIIFDLFQIDFTKYPTLPSNTMAIFRSNFLKDEFKIPLISGTMYNNLKRAYTGGMVDVYKPTNDPGTKVNSYDVNSLYPYSMFEFAVPIGKPIYFEGDILRINPNAFGVFEVEVETPTNLKYPVLQTKIKTDKGVRTITPLGTWTDWYSSDEIFNAIKFGYKFKVLRGYLFEKGYIFKDFVSKLYKIKENSKKGSAIYNIVKLLLNSLYGKLGIDPNYENHLIINSDKSQEYNHKYIITNVIDLGNNKELITYYKKSNKENINLSSDPTSVSIALAVTAYARIYMNQLKQIALALGLIIFYMDTDSLALSGILPPQFIGKELGKLKLEHVFDEVIFLAPKVYGGKNDSYELTKVKGLKNHITFNELKPLLTKDNSLVLNQDKWYKNIGKRFYSTKFKYDFRNVEFPLDKNTLLNNLNLYFDKFITENKAYFGEYISVICQVREVGNIYYTIGDRFPIDLNNPKDLTDYAEYIQSKWDMLDNNHYNPNLAISIIFNFTNTTLSNYSLISNKFRISKTKDQFVFDFKDEKPLGLPLNLNYESWGESSEILRYGILKISNIYKDLKNNINRYIEVISHSKKETEINIYLSDSNIKLATFFDKSINNNEFIRFVGNKTYYIKDNKLYFIYEKLISDKFISRARPSKGFNFNIMTLDVETFVDSNNKMNIYCISMFDGVKALSFYLTDYQDVHSLINDVLKTIFQKKYSGKNIYIHNSSEFDMIFLYSYIVNFEDNKIKPIIKDGKFINLDIEFGNVTKFKVYFKDSFLLLSTSLAKLSKTFNINHSKDIFPHKFVNSNNLNYIGEVPSIEFFNNISLVEYNEYKSRFNDIWSLKNEAIKYCELDCKALYEVLLKFAYNIFNKYKIDVSSTPTLPSVALKTYRTNFIPKDIQIAKIGGKMFDNIHKAFYGGHVDMYIPNNPIGTQVYGVINE